RPAALAPSSRLTTARFPAQMRYSDSPLRTTGTLRARVVRTKRTSYKGRSATPDSATATTAAVVIPAATPAKNPVEVRLQTTTTASATSCVTAVARIAVTRNAAARSAARR